MARQHILAPNVQSPGLDMRHVLQYRLSDHLNRTVQLSDIFSAAEKRSQHRVLLIFIRHFFCGNCQEYLKSLSGHPSFKASAHMNNNLSVVIVGCGSPSLIDSYRDIVGLPAEWLLLTDPSTQLYQVFGMHRTLSLGHHPPRYIQRSLAGNMLRSVVQGFKRLPRGDILSAGSWDVNGGEFLFAMRESEWALLWSHRMMNSRDHTEVEDLALVLGLGDDASHGPSPHVRSTLHARTQSSPAITENDSILDEKMDVLRRKASLRQRLSVGRQIWMQKGCTSARSGCVKVR